MVRHYRGFLTFFLCVMLIFLGVWGYFWKNPPVNTDSENNAWKCIHNDKAKETFKFKDFTIYAVANSSQQCVNPHFPTIQIQAHNKHDGWIQVIRTDSEYKTERVFIDTIQCINNNIYPFYSFEQDFYDSPIWRYSLHTKPLSFWKAHAWAVEIDFEAKVIKPVGGISWGFNLSYLQLRPEFIRPKLLKQADWENDYKILKTKFYQWRITRDIPSIN